MEGTENPRDAAARRRTELDERIRELHERNHELTTILMNGVVGRTGSSREQVRRAEELAGLASRRAAEAAERAVAMYLNSAHAHERAAHMHTLLAETGVGDTEQHRSRAREHLQRATEDRNTADVMISKQNGAHHRGG